MTYREVVEKAKNRDSFRIGVKNKHISFVPCQTWLDGDQINLWTYWQGYQIKDIDNGVDILLVGQDWGRPDGNEAILDRIRTIQRGENVLYYSNSPTAKNMRSMFYDSFGCDIAVKDPGKRLFFTNYSLGYREGSETGGMTKKILQEDKELFDDLVTAIKPKIIICLGKLTYEAATDTKVENYVQTLKSGYPLQTLYQGILTYGVPHCGSLGQRNVGGFDNMKRIWRNMSANELNRM